jgi:hypothetical protein
MTPPPMIRKSLVSSAAVPLAEGAAFWTIDDAPVEGALIRIGGARSGSAAVDRYMTVFEAVFEKPLSVPVAEYAVTTKNHCAGANWSTT